MSRTSIKDVLKNHREKVIFGGVVLLVVIFFIYRFSSSAEDEKTDFTPVSETKKYNEKTSKLDFVTQKPKETNNINDLESFWGSTQEENLTEQENNPATIEDIEIVEIDLEATNKNNNIALEKELEEAKKREKELKEKLSNNQVASYSSSKSGGSSNSNYSVEPPSKTKPKVDYKNKFKKQELNKKSTNVKNNLVAYQGAIRGEQRLKTGQNITLITNEVFTVNNIKVPKNTYIVGTITFSEYRANVSISTIKIGNKIHSVNLEVYGSDGVKGIPLQVDKILKKGKDDVIDEATSGSNVDKATRVVSNVLSSKAKDQVVTFIDNETVFFKVE